MRTRTKEIIALLVTLILFIIVSYFSNKYSVEINNLIVPANIYGIFVYLILVIIAVVIAPLDTLPLMPIAVAIWGPLLTAFLTIIGWTAGSSIAFWIARRFGKKLVCRIVNVCKLEEFELKLADQNIFWLIILARIFLPVDIISYAIGLFTKISWRLYLVATIIGMVPFAFIYSYGVTLPIIYQVIAGIVICLILLGSYVKLKKYFFLNKIF